MKNNQTICQFLNIKVVGGKPFIITHNDNEVYKEYASGFWWKCEYDANGFITYFENSDGFWSKSGYDDRGNPTSHENSKGFWWRKEFDSDNKMIYYVTTFGTILDNRPKEITLDQIAEKFDVSVEQLKIRK